MRENRAHARRETDRTRQSDAQCSSNTGGAFTCENGRMRALLRKPHALIPEKPYTLFYSFFSFFANLHGCAKASNSAAAAASGVSVRVWCRGGSARRMPLSIPETPYPYSGTPEFLFRKPIPLFRKRHTLIPETHTLIPKIPRLRRFRARPCAIARRRGRNRARWGGGGGPNSDSAPNV